MTELFKFLRVDLSKEVYTNVGNRRVIDENFINRTLIGKEIKSEEEKKKVSGSSNKGKEKEIENEEEEEENEGDENFNEEDSERTNTANLEENVEVERL